MSPNRIPWGCQHPQQWLADPVTKLVISTKKIHLRATLYISGSLKDLVLINSPAGLCVCPCNHPLRDPDRELRENCSAGAEGGTNTRVSLPVSSPAPTRPKPTRAQPRGHCDQPNAD